jgi:hypothetical protein
MLLKSMLPVKESNQEDLRAGGIAGSLAWLEKKNQQGVHEGYQPEWFIVYSDLIYY